MPKPVPEFVAHCCEMLSSIGRTSARAMFGGYLLKCDDAAVGLVAFDTLYLKVDEATKPLFLQAGCEPFRYEKHEGGFLEMSYWTVPPEAMESPAEMAQWARLAMGAARRAAAAKAASKSKVTLKKSPAKKSPKTAVKTADTRTTKRVVTKIASKSRSKVATKTAAAISKKTA